MDDKKYTLEEVFTPSLPAICTFVERQSVNKRLDRAIKTPGKQIVIYGYSGAGKTTILANKVKSGNLRCITTRCVTGMSLADIIIDAFNQLETYYTSSSETKDSDKIGGKLSASYLGIKASLSAENCGDVKTLTKRAVELPITPQTLAKYIGLSGNCWLIEDFHKISLKEKKQMSQIMKVFMDSSYEYPYIKIIAVGAVNTAREVVQYDPEMKNRIAEIEVPLMNNDDLEGILSIGQKLLNIRIPENVVNKIIAYSSGLPAVTHQLAYLLCEFNEISKTYNSNKSYSITSVSFDNALNEYLAENSDTLKSIYEQATRITYKRKSEAPSDILKAILLKRSECVTINEIREIIKITDKNYKGTNLKKYVDELTAPSRSEILRYNKESMSYYFSNPFIKAYCQCVLRIDVKGDINSKSMEKEFRKTLDRELEIAHQIFLRDFKETTSDLDYIGLEFD